MAGSTGVPTGLSPTAGVDYAIPLPYDVPDIATNRVGYYFAASSIGDAYRKAVRGDAEAYAWIQNGATMADSSFAAAFAEIPGQLTREMMRGWFRAAFDALERPGGSSVQATIITTPSGAATIVPKAAPAATTAAPEPAGDLTKDVAAYVTTAAPVAADGLPAAPAPAAMPLPRWVWWAGGLVAALVVLSLLGKRS